jgi:hypothetical protein
MVWIGSIWPRIGTGGGLMWMRWWTSGFHKMLGSSWVAAQLAASQEALSSMSDESHNFFKLQRRTEMGCEFSNMELWRWRIDWVSRDTEEGHYILKQKSHPELKPNIGLIQRPFTSCVLIKV